MSNVIEKLDIYERAALKDRAPQYRKWRALELKGINKIDQNTYQLIPADSTGITAEELDKYVTVQELNQNVPSEMVFDGGWVLFNGNFVGTFHPHKPFKKRYRHVPGKQIATIKHETLFVITKITKKEEGYVVATGETTWFLVDAIFETLKPEVGDGLTTNLARFYSIIPKAELDQVIDAELIPGNDELLKLVVEADLSERPEEESTITSTEIFNSLINNYYDFGDEVTAIKLMQHVSVLDPDFKFVREEKEIVEEQS